MIAGGDVVVSQGIVGDDTDVVARGLISMGTIQCKFIQTAKVLAKDTIEVGTYSTPRPLQRKCCSPFRRRLRR